MSNMTTRVGPLVVTHMLLSSGIGVNTISDTRDEDLHLVFEANTIDLAIRWAEEYIAMRYPDWKDEDLIGKKST